MLSTIRAFAPSFNRSQSRAFSTKTQMDSITKNPDARISRCASNSISTESRGTSEDTPITLQEWQGWGSTSPMPTMVTEIIEELKALEKNIDAQMSFGGNGGKLQVCHKFIQYVHQFFVTNATNVLNLIPICCFSISCKEFIWIMFLYISVYANDCPFNLQNSRDTLKLRRTRNTELHIRL